MSTMAVYKVKNGWCYKGRIPVPFQRGKYKDYYKSGFKKKSDAIKAEQAFRDGYSTNMGGPYARSDSDHVSRKLSDAEREGINIDRGRIIL